MYHVTPSQKDHLGLPFAVGNDEYGVITGVFWMNDEGFEESRVRAQWKFHGSTTEVQWKCNGSTTEV